MKKTAKKSKSARTKTKSAAKGRTVAAKRASSRRKPAPRATKKARPAPVPAGYHTVTPHLVCRGAADAMAFYARAFGAKERMRMSGPDGSVAHAEMKIGDSIIMLGDEMPQMGASAPPTIGGSPVNIFLYVKNVDKLFEQAVAAGATADMPPADMFWGDRYCKVTDPFGHHWSMATHIEDLSQKEMAKRGAAAMAEMGQG
jgi:uncharacterized glyoxalase superfamily protein PhnB